MSLQRLLPHFQVSKHVSNISLLPGSKKDYELEFEGAKQGQQEFIQPCAYGDAAQARMSLQSCDSSSLF